MLQSSLYMPTRREVPRESESRGEVFLLRAGVVRQTSSGARVYLPVGQRVIVKLRHMIRQALAARGALEIHVLQPKTGAGLAGGTCQQVSPGIAPPLDLGDVVASVVAGELRSYRDLPKIFFTFSFRYEDNSGSGFRSPKGKECLVTEVCSFDPTRESAQRSCVRVEAAFQEIFRQLGLDCRRVAADRDRLGFFVPLQEGFTSIGTCSACGYSATREFFPLPPPEGIDESHAPLERIYTPGLKTAEEVARFLGCPVDRLVKTMILSAGHEEVAVLLRGDHTVSETKLKNILGRPVSLASPEVIERVTRAPVGFAGPVNLEGVRIIADHWVRSVGPAVTGANEADYHLRGVVLDRDYRVDQWADLRFAQEGDLCGNCGAAFICFSSGIDLAQMELVGEGIPGRAVASYTDETGGSRPMVLCCHRLELSRLFDVLAESSADDRGLAWPVSVAPFEVHLLNLAPHQPEVHPAAQEVVDRLEREGWDVLHDDRDERPGVKFHDADLLGLPYLVVVGAKSLKEGVVEVGRRNQRERDRVSLHDVASQLMAWKREDLRGLGSAPS